MRSLKKLPACVKTVWWKKRWVHCGKIAENQLTAPTQAEKRTETITNSTDNKQWVSSKIKKWKLQFLNPWRVLTLMAFKTKTTLVRTPVDSFDNINTYTYLHKYLYLPSLSIITYTSWTWFFCLERNTHRWSLFDEISYEI